MLNIQNALKTFNPKTNSQIGSTVHYVLFYLIAFFPVITWHVTSVKVTSKVALMRDMQVQRDIYIYIYVCVCVCVCVCARACACVRAWVCMMYVYKYK